MNVFIPAHGFSNRVERKHTRPFAGKSLTMWTVLQCMASKHVDHCYVSTDDDEVAEHVYREGGEVIWRDYEQHPDDAGGVPTYHAIKDHPDYFYPYFLNLFVTSPLRPPDLIDRVIEAWEDADRPHALQAIGKQEETCLCMKTSAGYIMPFINKRGPWTNYTHTTQVLSAEYFMNDYETSIRRNATSDTVANAIGTDGLKASEVVPRPYIEVPWWQCTEPDTPEDFEVCEVLMETLILKGRGEEVYEEYKASWQ